MGFSYNDITSKSMGLKARLTSWQVSGRLRNFTTTVPGKYGVTDFGADFDYREIVVSCSIFPRHSFPALVSTLDDIAAWLDPVGVLKQLILDDVPDRYFMARLNAAVECERLLRSGDGALLHSVPQGQAMGAHKGCLFLYRARHLCAQQPGQKRPKAVARVAIIKVLSAAFGAGPGANNKGVALRRPHRAETLIRHAVRRPHRAGFPPRAARAGYAG